MRSRRNTLPQPPANSRLPQANKAISKCENCLTMIIKGDCTDDPISCGDKFVPGIGYIGTLSFSDPIQKPVHCADRY